MQLVFNPTDAHAFLPRLLPGLEHATKEVANPECREQVEKAHEALVAIGGNVEEHEAVPPYARPEVLLTTGCSCINIKKPGTGL